MPGCSPAQPGPYCGKYTGGWKPAGGDSKTEQKIKELTKATIRCIPFNEKSKGKCILTGDLNSKKVVFARAY